MKTLVRTVSILAALALAAAPAVALDNPGSDHGPPAGTTGPSNAHHGTSGPQGPPENAGPPSDTGQPSDVPPSQARALGKTECQKLKSSFGDNKSAFGKCIAAVAKGLQSDTPTKATFKSACKGLSHKKAKGQKHSPFSACVIAGARALND
jgi:hypothetical protein